MVKRGFNIFFWKKKGDTNFLTKNLVYWLLIAACVVIMWYIVNEIIHKLLTLY